MNKPPVNTSMFNKEVPVRVFVDNSTSTGGKKSYWWLVNEIYKTLISEGFIVEVILWNSEIEKVSEECFQQTVGKCRGTSDTRISSVAEFLVKNKIHSNIVLITDGEVYNYDVCSANETLALHGINGIICYVITSMNTNTNMSVTCPFTRGIHTVHIMQENTSIKTRVVTSDDIELLEKIANLNLEKFREVYERLVELLIAKHMGLDECDPVLKNAILSLRRQIMREISAKNGFGDCIRQALLANNLELAVKTTNQMVEDFQQISSNQDVKKLDYLVSLCGNMRGLYTVDQVKSSRVTRAANVKEATNPEEIKNAVCEVECQVEGEKSVPQILVINGLYVLSEMEKKKSTQFSITHLQPSNTGNRSLDLPVTALELVKK